MRIVSRTALLLALLATLSGCATTESNQASLPERYSLPETPRTPPPRQEGSIYSAGNATGGALSLYSDSRARKVGDIVLVRIVETSTAKKEANTKTQRTSTTTGGIGAMFGLEKWAAKHDGNFTPSLTELDATLTNDYQGKGSTDRKSNVTATISARVIDVTSDGNLAIRGYQEVKVNDETQHIILSGIVRPSDITPDNAVLSSHVADARIEYSGQGTLGDKQRPGWLARALDTVWPF